MALRDRVYSDAQKAAMAAAKNSGMTGKQVVELAGAGQLTTAEGGRLDPFETNDSSVRDYARKARLRVDRDMAALTHGSDVDLDPHEIRDRLLALANAQTAKLERRFKAGGDVDGGALERLGKAVERIHRLPRAAPPPAAAPEQRPPTSLAASILDEARAYPPVATPPAAPVIEETAPEPLPLGDRLAEELRVRLTAAQGDTAPEAPRTQPVAPSHRTLQSGPRPGQTAQQLQDEVGDLAHSSDRDEKPRRRRRVRGTGDYAPPFA